MNSHEKLSIYECTFLNKSSLITWKLKRTIPFCANRAHRPSAHLRSRRGENERTRGRDIGWTLSAVNAREEADSKVKMIRDLVDGAMREAAPLDC